MFVMFTNIETFRIIFFSIHFRRTVESYVFRAYFQKENLFLKYSEIIRLQFKMLSRFMREKITSREENKRHVYFGDSNIALPNVE